MYIYIVYLVYMVPKDDLRVRSTRQGAAIILWTRLTCWQAGTVEYSCLLTSYHLPS